MEKETMIITSGLVEPWSGVYRKVVAFGEYELLDSEGNVVRDDTILLDATLAFSAPEGYSLRKSERVHAPGVPAGTAP